MKNGLIAIALMFTLSNAFSQSIVEATSATTLLPFVTATRLLQSGTATIVAPLASTLATVQSRGVAGREQIKDDLVALNDDMASGVVNSIDEVRQPALKELFAEISADEEQMGNINSVVTSGSDLHKIATTVTIALLVE
ncbi:MAG: hypothetical protein NDI69_15745 [Bacteriovoracaceae bacterium]|nr:hypothetical protein [Bacteriovoracaceae bacterium]